MRQILDAVICNLGGGGSSRWIGIGYVYGSTVVTDELQKSNGQTGGRLAKFWNRARRS